MKFTLLHAREIDASLRGAWQNIRQTNPLYDNPFFCPEYTCIISEVREDARIVVCEDGGVVCGILPFHRRALSGQTIGHFLTDYQGPLTLPDVRLPVAQMLRAMRVGYFPFNHMPAARDDFAPFAWAHSRSQIINLAAGFDAYRQELEARGSSILKKTEQGKKQLAKRFGEVEFTLDSCSEDDFLTLLKGKSEQYVRTVGAGHDIFAQDWVRQAMLRFRQSRGSEFSGMLSCLHVGGTLIAAHFGIRSQRVLHYWFPWYRTDYAEFSPGLILLAMCAAAAPAAGIQSIDLGRGEQAYKLRFATQSQSLCEGAISRPDLIRQTQLAYRWFRQFAKASTAGQALVRVKQRMRNGAG